MIQPTNGAVTKRIFVIALQNLNFDKICGSLDRLCHLCKKQLMNLQCPTLKNMPSKKNQQNC